MKSRTSPCIILIAMFSSLMLFITPYDAFCSKLIHQENFDDQYVDRPPFGSIELRWGSSPPSYPDDYFWAPGRGGNGYAFSGAQNKAVGLLWWIKSQWPTDEIYVSFWMRYANYTQTSPGNENFKAWRPVYQVPGSTARGGFEFIGTVPDWHTAQVYADDGTILNSTIAVNTPGSFSTGWHQYEFWVKFSTAQFRMWYDGALKIDKNYPDQSGGQATWSGNIYYETLGSIDGEAAGIFMRQFDDWEVWDGLPPYRTVNNLAPSAPKELAIK